MQTITNAEEMKGYKDKAFKEYLGIQSEALLKQAYEESWVVRYDNGEDIIAQGSPILQVPILVDGIIACFYENKNGTETVTMIGGQYCFAVDHHINLMEPSISDIGIRVVRKSILVCLPASFLQKACRQFEEIKSLAHKVYRECLNYNAEYSRIRNLPLEERIEEMIAFHPELWKQLPERYKAKNLGITPEHWTRYKVQHNL